MRYLDEGGVQQLDGDYIPNWNSLSGSNYFERESQIMHFVSECFSNLGLMYYTFDAVYT